MMFTPGIYKRTILASIPVPDGVPAGTDNQLDNGYPFTVSTNSSSPGFIQDNGVYPDGGWIHRLRGSGGLSFQDISFEFSSIPAGNYIIYGFATHNGVAGLNGNGIYGISVTYGSPATTINSPLNYPPGQSVLYTSPSIPLVNGVTVRVITNANNVLEPNPVPITTVPFIGIAPA